MFCEVELANSCVTWIIQSFLVIREIMRFLQTVILALHSFGVNGPSPSPESQRRVLVLVHSLSCYGL